MRILLYILALSLARAETVKTIRLCEKGVAPAVISTRGTVLEFPLEPEKVILGTKGSFSIEYVRSDLAISPLSPTARSNLFVYLSGRRFTLELSTSSANGNTLSLVKDCLEDQRGKPERRHGRN